MDNFMRNDNSGNSGGQQASQSMVGCHGESNLMEYVDLLKRQLGLSAAKSNALGSLLSQPSQVALSAEVGHTVGNVNDKQVGGSHYQDITATGICPHCRGVIQHWDWAGSLPGLEYAATKYITRWRIKGGLESLRKAVHYVAKIVEQNFPGKRVTFTIEDVGQIPASAPAVDGIREPKNVGIYPHNNS